MHQLISNNKLFYYFPKNQNICLLYSNVGVLKTRLFKALSIQVSSKNSFFLRIRKTRVGHFFYNLLFLKRKKLNLPGKNIQIGYYNNNKLILFEFEKQQPIFVYKKNNNSWVKLPFLGYSLIESYSKNEYFKKKKNIEEVLAHRWKQIMDGQSLHGDFTHFNILINDKDKFVFIDEKKVSNSPLFDIYYFQSYYFQCLENCKTISKKNTLEVKRDFNHIVKNVLKYTDEKDLIKYVNLIDNSFAFGLITEQKEKRFEEFKSLILS